MKIRNIEKRQKNLTKSVFLTRNKNSRKQSNFQSILVFFHFSHHLRIPFRLISRFFKNLSRITSAVPSRILRIFWGTSIQIASRNFSCAYCFRRFSGNEFRQKPDFHQKLIKKLPSRFLLKYLYNSCRYYSRNIFLKIPRKFL